MLSGTTLFSTSDVTACTGNTDDDAWFSFQLPENHTSALFKLQSDLGGKLGMQVFRGECTNLILQECFDSPWIDDISGLEPGQTYWIQIYTLDDRAAADFTLSLAAGPMQPDNDDCVNATSITSYPGYFVDPGPQSTAGATNSGVRLCYPFDEKTPDYAYDVWYSFVTDYTGGDATVTIHFNDPPVNEYEYLNFHLQGFEGQCNNLTTLSCLQNDDVKSGFKDSTIVMNLYGLKPATSYYFRVLTSSDTRNYAPVDFTVFAEGTAMEGTVGIEDHGADHQGLEITRYYPSPAHNVLNIDYVADDYTRSQLYMTDLLGHVIQQKELLTRQGENHETLQFDQVPSGLYIIYIENEKGRSQPKRFVVE
ncbi:MAG: T9SS type A sorting domain-containing protein [Saprospiraceae bacterium]|uniref:T9SS type A sorting domain-containing protein n=1 Tax=Candidatus Opimibacter skivensis TaxID=2982028 RepID=A0A9D7SRR3_9BACT|nr:T9SS type A sorting domain-containing protein [Candidatus Opimibacter skivensis]